MTKVHLFPRKADGTPDINAFGQLIDIEDLPPGSIYSHDITTNRVHSGHDTDPIQPPIVYRAYIAPS